MRLLAELARTGMSNATPNVTNNAVDSWRRRTSQKVQEIQELIESSKFESGSLDLDALQKHTGDAQIIFVLLLSLARQRHDPTRLPETARKAEIDLNTAVAAALEAMAFQVTGGSNLVPLDLYDALNAFEHSIVGTDALDEQTPAQLAGRLVVHRALVAAVKRISSEPVCARQDGHEVRVLAVQ
jgi:hypothetical protein